MLRNGRATKNAGCKGTMEQIAAEHAALFCTATDRIAVAHTAVMIDG